MNTSLNGIRVIDLTRVIAGPHCTMILGDLGAEVIKIEKKGSGDLSRKYAPFYKDESTYFITHNRNKKSVELDVRNPKGIEIIKELIKDADVLAENFKAGTLEKMGLSPDTLWEINPKLVITRLSGFGQEGPYSSRPCFDAVAQSMSGLMELNGDPDGPPMMIGTYVADMMSGVYAALGTVAALRECDISGHGQVVDVALFDVASALTHSAVTNYFSLGLETTRTGNQDRASWPATFYPTKENRWVFIHAGQDPAFRSMCKMIGREDLVEKDEFKTIAARSQRIEECDKIVADWTSQHCIDDIIEECNKANLPCAKVNKISEMAVDEQLLYRKMIREVDMPKLGKMKVNGPVIKMSNTPTDIFRTAPLLGADTNDVMKNILHYSDEKISDLKENNVI